MGLTDRVGELVAFDLATTRNTKMKIQTLFTIIVIATLTGCETTRVASDVGAGAGGAYLGSKVNGKWGPPVGAAVGVVGSEVIQQVAESHAEHEYNRGYDRGKADGVKQMMEGLELNHLPQRSGSREGGGRTTTFELPDSEAADGANLIRRKYHAPVN